MEAIMRRLDSATTEMEGRVKYVEEEQKALADTKREQERIKDECEKQFAEVVTQLKDAIVALKKLSKGDITELKSIKKPTKCVYTLIQCVCIVMNVEKKQAKKPGPDGKYHTDWWVTASSSIFANMQLADTLGNFNPDTLTQDIVNTLLKARSENKEFNEANMTKACTAAKGLYQWLSSIENYYYIYELAKPKRDALVLAEQQIVMHEKEIESRKEHLKELQLKLSELKTEY
jgi:dynein heavy chain